MRDKKGFIAMSLIYTFFLLFITLMIALLINFSHTKGLTKKINAPIIEDLEKRNNPLLSSVILEAHPPVSDATSSIHVTSASGIDFTAINSPTNGQGLYINNKANVAGDSTLGTIKYFRGGTYCAYTGYNLEDTSGAKCTAAGGTWDSTYAYCSLYDSKSVCESKGFTYYELKNNVMFAGFAWKIIRINADGSIRLIYNGPTSRTRGVASVIGGGVYSNDHSDPKHAGYTYDGTDSAMKARIDSWYNTNLSLLSDNIVQNAKYCNDTTTITCVVNDQPNSICYGSYQRTNTGRTPTYECPVTDKSYGGEYSLNIGALSIDETVYAGAIYATPNYTFYLRSGVTYWTMSPDCSPSGNMANVWYISYIGPVYGRYTTYATFGTRPVINLKPDAKVSSGTGTLDDPWIVVF